MAKVRPKKRRPSRSARVKAKSKLRVFRKKRLSGHGQRSKADR